MPPAEAALGLDGGQTLVTALEDRPAQLRRHVLDAAPAGADPAADREFADLLAQAAPRLISYAWRRLGDRHEAEELCQEALLRAFERRDQLRTANDVMAWTTVVVGRLVIDRLRVRGRSIVVAEVPETARVGRDTAEVAVARDEARTALDALAALPSRQAAVLWAREVEGLGYDEIGRAHGMSAPTVRSLLMRARRSLRREYVARGGSLPAAGIAVLAPWLHPLRAAGALRRAAVGSTAVVAVGGLLALAPWRAPVTRPAVPSVVTPERAVPAAAHTATQGRAAAGAAAPQGRAQAPARGPVQAPAVAVAAPGRASVPKAGPILPSACVGQVGLDCRYPDRAPDYQLLPQLPVAIGLSVYTRSCELTALVTCVVVPALPSPTASSSLIPGVVR